MESQLSSLTLSEKMSERLWDENASLKQDKAILKAKLKASKTELVELRGQSNRVDLNQSIAEQVIGEVYASIG